MSDIMSKYSNNVNPTLKAQGHGASANKTWSLGQGGGASGAASALADGAAARVCDACRSRSTTHVAAEHRLASVGARDDAQSRYAVQPERRL